MTDSDNSEKRGKADVFFARARDIADTSNFDYAIAMYIEGLRCEPDDVTMGHVPLRELALRRQARGGKKPSMKERIKLGREKDTLEQMLSAEYLLAKDPDHLPYAQAMLKAAVGAGYTNTVQWLADLLFQANTGSGHPSVGIYILLKNAYESIGQYNKAIVACYQAAKLRPEDAELSDEYKRLSAEMTVSRGKYDTGEDFRKAVKDSEHQKMLQAEDGVVKSDVYRNTLIEAARKELAENPDSVQSILHLANTLAELETEESENEAIKILEDAYGAKGDFAFKNRAGEIAITQLKRKIRNLAPAEPGVEGSPELAELREQLKKTQLEHWKSCVQNYPTDLASKYEYAAILLENGQYDEAIPLFQQAQRDPRRRISAMAKTGLCFYHKGWFDDAIDIFNRAINAHELKEDSIGKDLCYNLGLCYEQKGLAEKALEIYRKIAQIDFGYRDVSERVEKLRDKSGND